MSAKRLIALVLILCLLLVGCGNEPSIKGSVTPPKTTTEPQETATAEENFFEPVERSDMPFEQMLYFHYDEAEFMSLCEGIYALAEQGCEDEQEAADMLWEARDELELIYDLLTLAEIEYHSDPSDAEAAEEMDYASELYYRMSDEYMYALGALAASENSGLMEWTFYADEIEYFAAAYGSRPEGSGEELELYKRETELVNEYYSIMAEIEPDVAAAAEVYVKLVENRREEAAMYGYEGYADYAYSDFYFKDYYPSDSAKLWAGVKEYFVPLVSEHYDAVNRAADRVSLAEDVDCSTEAVLAALERNLPKISPELYEAFDFMLRNGLYNIDFDPRKADMGYTTRLYYYDVPFVFNAPYGEFYDYLDMIHEFGHYANTYYTYSDLIFGAPDNDLCELQSQGLEMLFTAFYEDIFGKHAAVVEDYVLMDMLYSIVDGAMYDEFQQRVYAEEDLTPERVSEIFTEVYADYGYEPYEGYEYEWVYVVHNFEYPFYYISYAVSALGALEIYSLMQGDFEAAVDKYLQICAMDAELYYYSEALGEAGFADIFDSECYAAIAEDIKANFE